MLAERAVSVERSKHRDIRATANGAGNDVVVLIGLAWRARVAALLAPHASVNRQQHLLRLRLGDGDFSLLVRVGFALDRLITTERSAIQSLDAT